MNVHLRAEFALILRRARLAWHSQITPGPWCEYSGARRTPNTRFFLLDCPPLYSQARQIASQIRRHSRARARIHSSRAAENSRRSEHRERTVAQLGEARCQGAVEGLENKHGSEERLAWWEAKTRRKPGCAIHESTSTATRPQLASVSPSGFATVDNSSVEQRLLRQKKGWQSGACGWVL